MVGETKQCIEVLSDSKEFTESVDLALCRSLLDNALLAGQQLIVAHILNWHLEASDDSPRILPGVLGQCIAMLATYAEEKVVLDAFAVRLNAYYVLISLSFDVNMACDRLPWIMQIS